MAGKPLLRELERLIADKLGGDSWVLDRLADGVSVGTIAAELAPMMMGGALSRRMLYWWRDNAEGGADGPRAQAWREALTISASAHAEDGRKILDDLADRPKLTAADAALANSRSSYRKWQATVMDRPTYGDAPAVAVQLNVSELHLDALKAAALYGRQGSHALLTSPSTEETETETIETETRPTAASTAHRTDARGTQGAPGATGRASQAPVAQEPAQGPQEGS